MRDIGAVRGRTELDEKKRRDGAVKQGSERVRIITSTRKGDRGETSLLSGERVSKANPRIEIGGNLDESNAALGLAKAFARDETIRSIIGAIQKHMVILGAEISSTHPGREGKEIQDEHIIQAERWTEELQREVPLPRHFVDPGENPVSAALDLARSIVRRTERSMVASQEAGHPLRQQAVVYMNRLGCLVFTLARYAEKMEESQVNSSV